MINLDNIEINEQFRKAIDILENTNKSVFITGKAGTGKSTLLQYFRDITKKNIVVLATTGVAAVNIQGQTLHSFFKFGPDITIDKIEKLDDNRIYKIVDTIIIDEVSMLRADVMDCVDYFLRLNCKKSKPFGGKQMVFIGDLYQLPPVVKSSEKEIFSDKYETPYFFSADVFKDFEFEFIELEKIYRQTDQEFINLLNSIRNNTITEEQLNLINQRYNPDFVPSDNEIYIYLTPYNKNAQKINEEHLKDLKGQAYKFRAEIVGDFDKNSYPTDEVLILKKGAQIMLLNNDPKKRWVNGSVGVVKKIDKENEIIIVELLNGKQVTIEKYKWDIFQYYYDKSHDKINTEIIGSFIQFPIKLAWAITIHKSQGKTFDKVIIDLDKGTFSPGQVYVALSRCTSLDGIVLKQKIKKSNIFIDNRIIKFLTNYQYKISNKRIKVENKEEIIQNAIKEQKDLEIVYLKKEDEKTRRKIKPLKIGEFYYMNKKFRGLEAYCYMRDEIRNFRIDRILEIKVL